MRWSLVRDHVREGTVDSQGRVVVFVSMLSFSPVVDWYVFIFE